MAKPLLEMKASRLAALTVILAVLASLAVSAISLAAPDELLLNGGFEDDIVSDGVPDHWSPYSGALGLTSDSDFVHSGDFAAELTSTSPAAWIYQIIAVTPGETYTLSGYAWKNNLDIDDEIYLRTCFLGTGTPLFSYDSVHLTEDSAEYCRLNVTATAPEGAHSARVEGVLELNPTATGFATAYFDDMSFEGPPPPTSTPTPTPTPTPAPTPTAGPTATPPIASTATPTPTPTPTPTLTPNPIPAGTTANTGDVLINEVQYNPPQTGHDASFEWVELLNCTNEPVELVGWRISDNRGSDPIPSLTLLPHGFAVIAATQDFYDNFPDFTGTIVFIEDGQIGRGLSNDGDRLILEDSAATIIDALSYGDDDTIMLPPCQDVAEGHSLERQPAGLDTDRASDFVDNPNPTPGSGLAMPTPTPSPTPTPAPTPTAGPTATPTIASTATPTAFPPSSPTPKDTTPPPEESPASPGMALRAIIITAALAFFAIVFWFGIRRRRK